MIPANPKHCFQFGWESELTPSEAGPLLAHYEPLEGAWSGTETEAEKIAWLRAKIASYGLGDKRALLRRSPSAPDTLPALAYRDDTGNIEVRDGTFASLDEAMASLLQFEALAGKGSLQLTLSQPTGRFFAKGAAAAEEQLGWLSFFLELDTLARLARGIENEGSAGRELTKNFQHPFLGPLSRRRKKSLTEYLRANAVGGYWGEEELRWAGFKDRSFKFVGGTTYRPDVAGPARVCFEIRDAHKSSSLLRERAERVLLYWERDLSSFSRFAELPAFDPEADFDPLPSAVKEALARWFPCRAPEALRQYPVSLQLHEVFRNFAYPLRPWGAWVKALRARFGDAGEVQAELARFQEKYLAELSRLAALPASGDAEGRLEAQRSLARFAHGSPLLHILRRWERAELHGE